MAKASNKTTPSSEEKEKAGFQLPTILLRKLKYICAVEDEYQNDIAEEAFTKYIAEWEKKNGEIKLK